MIIYPLDPEELDDKTLSRQIKNIAQVLCNVHWFQADRLYKTNDSSLWMLTAPHTAEYEFNTCKIPLNPKNFINDYTTWASECRANYLNLLNMGAKYCYEYSKRFSCDFKIHKMKKTIDWAFNNIPDLSHNPHTPFPLAIPKKYHASDLYNPESGGLTHSLRNRQINIIKSYRDYYRSKIYGYRSTLKWTGREEPEWLS